MEQFLNGKVTLHRGDCLEVLPTLADSSVDACVCDPPYHLTSTNRGSTPGSVAASKDVFRRVKSGGFMGKQWDGGDIAFRPEVWIEVLRVLKPGGHLLAFSGTRTYHRMACAIEDAGFEIRDQIGWAYGSGFPKSHDISKAIDRAAGAEREILQTRIRVAGDMRCGNLIKDERRPDSVEHITAPATDGAIQWQGWGTALKPAWEPICLARKSITESSIAANVLKHGTGAINVDGCRVGTEKIEGSRGAGGQHGKFSPIGAMSYSHEGRWPANLIHDGSEEVLEGFPECNSARASGNPNDPWHGTNHNPTSYMQGDGTKSHDYRDVGSAARFFYTAKADVDDRLGSKHPTVKPIDLMQYLVRLITPKGGTVLDPFAGTGTCAEAAFYEGMRAILIEREPEYQADIVKRMGLVLSGPDTRRGASIKQESLDDTPLFGRLVETADQ